MIRRWRATAKALGVAVLAWQVGDALNGGIVHFFLVVGVVVGLFLVVSAAWPGDRASAVIGCAPGSRRRRACSTPPQPAGWSRAATATRGPS